MHPNLHNNFGYKERIIKMEKTKLGISISVVGAGLYFIGMMGIVATIIAAGYVLLFEENQWLKRVAVKAVAVVLFFAILSQALSLFSDGSLFISTLAALFNGSVSLIAINRIITLVRITISVASTFTLLALGFKALKMADFSVGPVDSLIDKNR